MLVFHLFSFFALLGLGSGHLNARGQGTCPEKTSNALFKVPSGGVAKVSIIDSTLSLTMPADYLLNPSIEGFDMLNDLPSWSFLVENENGRKALFDLGVPPNISSYAPDLVRQLKETGWGVSSQKNVAEIFSEHGTDPASIDSIVWRYVPPQLSHVNVFVVVLTP